MRKGIHFVHYKLIKHQRSAKEPQLECVILESVQRDRSPKMIIHNPVIIYWPLMSLQTCITFFLLWSTTLEYFGELFCFFHRSQWGLKQNHSGSQNKAILDHIQFNCMDKKNTKHNLLNMFGTT